ncbi:TIGR03618 family F420-dependent PPOX class oxidoreductase [Mycobacterium conspicuum]|jgi:PPOX class probable F420-dependent enzyme|uniref:PPOX class F420-dependent enzyme n=1 Tax=Mycobacterium conspicuum TaxID=44010 RepID=A0A1X1TJZ1_9MYCO|nr:TIGR03618 family F420-dependent PPOX class oxidoreductase [Mycobacterium conspicuum]ORV44826.1 oxidoreductase [Mycobacterium conspicuum]BBZ42586.1 PPOX class F420-dependent enzyme [Mycobacterium conspicuum]
MKLNDAARDLIGKGVDATLVTLNPDGSPQVSLVWVQLQSAPDGEPDGDELVTAHLGEHKKVRNVRNDPRVALTIAAVGDVVPEMRPYLAVYGTARIVEGGAPEVLKELAQTLSNPEVFPPAGAPPGFLTRIRIDKIGGIGPWAS